MTRRERPVLIYDGDCAFCTSCVRFAGRHLPATAEFVAFQHADLRALGTTAGRAEREVVWVGRDGAARGGAQAVAALLLDAGGRWWPLGAIARIPPFRWIAHALYRLIARNRHRLPGGTAACALPPGHRPGSPAG
jgi:predicted DCC family thiol-disulfide oxidoreductase YuxK